MKYNLPHRAVSTPPERHDVRAGKYLVFQLAAEEFAIKVLAVREIIRLPDVTRVPHTPDYVRGVINLRGKVMPVVDLRMKFGFPVTQYQERTCTIVIDILTEAGVVPMAAIVDGVCEVVEFTPEDIEDTPDFGGADPSPYLLGIARSKDKVCLLLQIDLVMATQELQELNALLTVDSEGTEELVGIGAEAI